MTGPEVIAICRDVAVAGAAVTTATVAVRGLGTWRRQLAGAAEYDLARRILVSVYRTRDAITEVRSPFMAAAEFKDRPDRAGTSVATDADDLMYAYNNRLSKLTTALSELLAHLVEAEAVWGRELHSATAALTATVLELRSAIYFYVRGRSGDVSAVERGKHERFSEVVFAGLASSGNLEEDPFSQRVAKAVEQFEERLRRHLPRRAILQNRWYRRS